MTSVAHRPRPRPSAPPERPATGLLLAGVFAALQAVGLGLLVVAVPVLVSWATATGSGAGAGEAVRSALQVWLLAHGSALRTGGGTVSVMPLGLTALLGLLLAHSAARAARVTRLRAGRPVARLVWVTAATYALVVAVLAVPAGGTGVHPGAVAAVLGALVLAGLSAGLAVTRAAGMWPVMWAALPDWWRPVAAAAAAAVTVLVTGGALVAGLATAAHLSRTADLTDRLQAGWVGTAVVALVSLALVPNAVLAGVGYVTGTGFAVGAGTVVAPGQVALGAVPALPVLGGLPEHPVPVLGWAALTVPVVAGLLAGRQLAAGGPGSWRDVLTRAGAAGLLAAAAVAALSALAGGSAGGHRLREIGPVWWQAGPAAGLEVALVAAATLAVLTWRWRRSVK